MKKKKKSGFLFGDLVRGLLWLLAIIIVFILIKDTEFIRDSAWLHAISGQEWLVYIVFGLSEIIFGLVPPEFFMIWSLHHGISDYYIINVLFLAAISYAAGSFGYYVGFTFSKTSFFDRIYQRFLFKYEEPFKKFSGFILFVAAVTPMPFSAMCMLVGTIKYPLKKFYLITLTRILRFAIYGYIIWQVNSI